ncbi:MAG: response regulator [Clostridiales bacterium]|nr:response regulator [Clostridiales bacterium]
MIKIMIVDDETPARNQIRNELIRMGIDEKSLLEAQNGVVALGKAKECKIDILITDISMPRMPGTDLAKHILTLYPDCKIIFLTGYSDKEYFKAAIKLNVIDYIEKPLDYDELEQAVKKAVSEFEKLNKSNKKTEFDFKFLEALFKNQHIDKSTLPAQCSKALESTKFVAAIIEPCSEYTTAEINLLEKSAEEYSIRTTSRIKANGSIELLFSGSTVNMKRDIEKIFNSFFSSLKEGEKFKCGIGSFEKQVKNIYMSYENAVCALDNAFFYHPNRAVYYTDNISAPAIDADKITEELHSCFSAEDFDNACGIINSLYDSLHQSNCLLSSNAKKIYYTIFESIHSCFKNYYFAQEGEHSLYEDSFNIHESHFLDDLHNYMISTINLMKQRLSGTDFNILVKSALIYIERNYQNPNLSIVDIAMQCNVNANYLCSMFKSVTGETINYYVNKLRIENAKKMMLETNMTIVKISQRCGFNDAKYFCKVFAKYTDLTPTNFRKKYK